MNDTTGVLCAMTGTSMVLVGLVSGSTNLILAGFAPFFFGILYILDTRLK